VRLRLTVNSRPCVVDDVWEGESLLFVLRERLGLWGAKNACEQGECGSCSVVLDGVLVCACLVGAGQADGSVVVTVEGLGAGERRGEGRRGGDGGDGGGGGGGGDGGGGIRRDGGLGPVQEAFLEAGAVQCGFCTPGLIMATHDLLRRVASPTDGEIREALAGNLCRCTGYEQILDAVRLAAARVRTR
jgi:aerobic carbon-monoxide dehydrogenase small subunit